MGLLSCTAASCCKQCDGAAQQGKQSMSVRSILARLCARMAYRSEALDALGKPSRSPSLRGACCLHSLGSEGRAWFAVWLAILVEHFQEVSKTHLLLLDGRQTCTHLTWECQANPMTTSLQIRLCPVHQ